MAARIGIELGPVACRIAEVEDGGPLPCGGPTRVCSFGTYVRPGHEFRTALEALRGRSATLVAWGLDADHAQPLVRRASYDQMRREALDQRARAAGIRPSRRLADIAPAAAPKLAAASRPVMLVSAHAAAVAAAVRPIASAGIRVRSVITPAAALMTLARRRQPASNPGVVEAYVALAETTTAVALVRGGHLLAAHEAPWGYLDPGRCLLVRPRTQVAGQLAAYLEAFFATARPDHGPVSNVLICGGMPELRSMAASLIESLDVEVEPLDSFFGIDTERLPEDGVDLRDRGADLRLAWAAAVQSPAPLDLLRERRHGAYRAWIARAAVVAGVTTGLGIGYTVGTAAWGLAAGGPAGHAARAPHTARPAPRPVEADSAPIVPDHPQRPTGSRIAAASFVRSYEPPPDLVFDSPNPERPSAAGPDAGSGPPFQAELQTILYGNERRLAVIDGHIVQAGDEVRGARVVAITATSVVVRDVSGRDIRLLVPEPAK